MIRCVRVALPLLRIAEWGRIVNISAQSTKRPSASLVAYTATKAMVTSVTKNLSLSLAKGEILVNTVSPGAVFSESLVRGPEGIASTQRTCTPRCEGSGSTWTTPRIYPVPAPGPRSVQ